MSGETPQQPGSGRVRRRARRAAACVGAGAVLGATAAICLGLRVLSFQQAIAMAVPAVALLGGGLVALALPDPSTGRRRGAETGFLIGTLLSLFRPGTRERGDGAEPNNHALA